MNALRKVLVVDSGRRGEATDLLSTELAELGVSSVTTHVEAAREVLGMIERPSAIFLNMPSRLAGGERERFLLLAAQLRSCDAMSGVPVIEYDHEAAHLAGGVTAVLRNEIGPQALAEPEL